MKKIILTFFIFHIVIFCFASVGYERKSISSVETIWVSNAAKEELNKISPYYIDALLDYYVKMPRFDFNTLPEPLLVEFRNQATALGNNITVDALTDILNSTVAPKIKDILEDDDIRASRANDIHDESWKVTFAGSKGRSTGLTVEDIEKLMNSSYIYLPYIKSITLTRSNYDIIANVSGGIIWYNVEVSPTGETNIVLKVSAESNSTGRAKDMSQSGFTIKNYWWYKFNGKKYNNRESGYAVMDALESLMKNLQVKTKEISEFNIFAQITDVKNGSFGARIGTKEGVKLDDVFFVVEAEEKSDGRIVSNTVGFARAIKIADNKNDSYENSFFYTHYSKRLSEGLELKEHPRLGFDILFNAGFQTMMQVHAVPLDFEEQSFNDSEIHKQILLSTEVAFNIAQKTGISQLFFLTEGFVGIPLDTSEFGMLNYGGYLGIGKKYWIGRFALVANVKGGFEMWHYLHSIYDTYDYNFAVIGVKSGLSANIMLSPEWLFVTGADYKIGISTDKNKTDGLLFKCGLSWTPKQFSL
jgi:hypothetical protein